MSWMVYEIEWGWDFVVLCMEWIMYWLVGWGLTWNYNAWDKIVVLVWETRMWCEIDVIP